MLMMVKSGKRHLSGKAIYRLEQAEREAGITDSERKTPSPLDRLAEQVEKRGALGIPLAELYGKDQAIDAALDAATPELLAMARLFSQFAKAGEKRLSAIESELKTLRADLNLKKKPKR